MDLVYQPREQFMGLHLRNQRWACIVAHRRAGKTVACVNELLTRALATSKENARYAYVAPYYHQAKQIAWDYLKRYGSSVIVKISESELSVDLVNGSKIRLFGADNPDSLRGLYMDGVVLDEYADMRPSVWGEIVRPMLADRKGWAVFIGTPKGHNAFYDIYQLGVESDDWFTLVLRASESGLLDADELADARKVMTIDQFEQEFECSFEAAIHGAVYGRWIAELEKQGRIKKGLYDESLPVHTAWDLGFDDATAIWFWQVVRGEIRLIDYYENSGEGIEHYCEVLKSKAYKYGKHFVPHDAANKLMAAGGRSIVQQAFALDVKMFVVPATSQQNGIEAARKTLEITWIDSACKDGIEALKQYQFEYDEDKKTFKSKPRHDWASHSCFIGQTNILTQYGLHPIMNQPKEGMVWTLCGWKRYTNLKKTQKNARLVEVVFSDGLSVKCTPDHLFLTESGWKSAESLTTGLRIQSCWIPSPNILMVVYTGYGHLKGILHGAVRNCIERFGRMPLVKYLRGVISIIKTETLPIITSRILNVWTQQSTLNLQLARILMPLGLEVSLKKPETKQLIGTHQRKAGYGIRDTQNAQSLGQNGSEKRNYVLNALKNLMPLFGRAETLKYFAQYHAGMLHIESVKKLDEREDVWCLTVEGTKSFALENGAVVHNCDAFEIIGQVWQNPKQLEDKPTPRFLHDLTAKEVFWPETQTDNYKRI